jgi:hypothetical protein
MTTWKKIVSFVMAIGARAFFPVEGVVQLEERD